MPSRVGLSGFLPHKPQPALPGRLPLPVAPGSGACEWGTAGSLSHRLHLPAGMTALKQGRAKGRRAVSAFPFCLPEHRRTRRDQPTGAGQGWPESVAAKGRVERPPAGPRSAGNSRQVGRRFFGYFLVAVDKKVTRPTGGGETRRTPKELDAPSVVTTKHPTPSTKTSTRLAIASPELPPPQPSALASCISLPPPSLESSPAPCAGEGVITGDH